MATAKIEAAIATIPEKKESLRKALEALRNYLASSSTSSSTSSSSSSSSSSFPFSIPEWSDLDAHISSVEATIHNGLAALKAKEASKPAAAAPTPASFLPYSKETPSNEQPSAANAEAEAVPRPELKSLCINMDVRGLVSFIAENRKDLTSIRNELTPAIRSAPDPAKLVLDALDAFFSSPLPSPPKGDKDIEALATRRTCINLLERVLTISPEISPSVKEQAKKLAVEWKGKVIDGGRDNGLEIIGLLQLIASYELVSEFKVDELLDLLILISRRKQVVDLCKSLRLTENVPDLIDRLNSKGRQLDAVRFVYAFNLLERYPPVPLLRAYINEIKKAAQDVRDKGNKSAESENVATSKELGALKSVLKAVEEYKLEIEYPREFLDKQIAKLEKRKESKKRKTAAAAASNSKSHKHQPPNKRPWLSATKSTATAEQTLPPGIAKQAQFGFVERSPHMGLTGPFGFAATPGYQSPPRSYFYSAESLTGATAGVYDRPVNYSVYPPVGLPPSYNSSLYP